MKILFEKLVPNLTVPHFILLIYFEVVFDGAKASRASSPSCNAAPESLQRLASETVFPSNAKSPDCHLESLAMPFC